MKKLLLIIGAVLLLTGCTVEKIKQNETIKQTDAEKFSSEYKAINIDKNNPYVYKTAGEIIDILENGTGIIYFGFPECPWCKQALPVLTEAAKELEIEKIYYFDPKEIRDANTVEYQKIVSLLSDYLNLDENGKKRLSVPDVYFVSGGKIIGHHFKTIDEQTDPVNQPLTDAQKETLKNTYKQLMSKTYNIQCDCN